MFKTLVLGLGLASTIAAGTTDMFEMVRDQAMNMNNVKHVAAQMNPYGDPRAFEAQQAAFFHSTERLSSVARFAQNFDADGR